LFRIALYKRKMDDSGCEWFISEKKSNFEHGTEQDSLRPDGKMNMLTQPCIGRYVPSAVRSSIHILRLYLKTISITMLL
jgi:hypothetical protein